MPNCVDIEYREEKLAPRERALARDSYVRSFEAQFADWTAIAKACIEVERDRDYELLGFHSWNAWLMDAAPKSRSYIYLVVNRYKELAPDIPDSDLAQIPLGSAGVLKSLSSKIRQTPKVVEAAKNKPSEFRQVLEQEFPGQHVEGVVEQRLKFTTSQWAKIEAAWETFKLTDETASLETFIEWLVSEAE